jgi:ABC-type branched-subunit amino acid transport system ATPase component/ABC-type branched-subunit amino acid transport system permease subunit
MRRWLVSDRISYNLIFFGIFLCLPFFLEQVLGRTALLASEILIFALVGLGFNILLGYTGLLSFGHGMFVGLGAYGTSLFQIHFFEDSLVIPIVLGTILTTLIGAVVGYLVMRKRGVYFSLLTLAFTQLFFYVCFRWTSLTGGENGLSGIVRPDSFLGLDLNNDYAFYYLTLVVMIVCTILVKRVLNAPFGRVLQAIRDNEVRASCVGYNTKRYKHIAVILSAFFCGVAGSFYAFLLYFAFPELFFVLFSGDIVAMTIVGGMRNFFGPIMGGAIFVLFKDLLSSITKHWMVFFGMIFMAFILFSPNGIMGILQNILGFVKREKETPANRPVAPSMPVSGSGNPQSPERDDPEVTATPDAPPSEEDILQVDGATKRFGALVAVNGVSFSVRKGELRSIIGPNGAGKTTLFNILTGVLPIDSGRVTFKGRDVTGLPPHRIADHGVARSFQIISIFKDLTVFENIRVAVQAMTPYRFSFVRATETLTDINGEAARIMDQVGLGPMGNQLASNISHGDQRLLEIAITLATSPEVLMLDEPLAGLAAGERVKIARLVRSLAGKYTVILIDHDIDQVLAISDRITVLHQGEVIAEGKPEEVKANPLVQEAYIGGFELTRAPAAAAVEPGETPILDVVKINTFYGKSHILHDVSLKIFKGELVCFLGRNGAGKTTTLHSIMGYVPPQSGDIYFMGKSIARNQPEMVARVGIHLSPQGRRIFPNLTVEENLNLAFMQAKKGGNDISWTPERAFEIFPQLAPLNNRRGENLSGGELQMLAIARALMGNGQLLMLDEPFEGLAPTIVESLWKVINELKRDTTILLVEQNAEVALSLGERAYVINNGMIEYDGSTRELTENDALRIGLLGV